MNSRLLGAACICFSVVSVSASASIIDNGTYTTDTDTGLDWLDLTATANMSYLEVSAQLGTGGTFEGWAYATRAQVSGFWDAFGGDPTKYNGWSTQNNGLFDLIAPLWGDLYCTANACPTGDGFSFTFTADTFNNARQYLAIAYDLYDQPDSATQDYFALFEGEAIDATKTWLGSALIRPRAVPVPAALWLFGSGLIGLVGMARRKAA